MHHNNILIEISQTPIGDLADKPVAELADMQNQVELLIAQADNVRKWLNGALCLKYGDIFKEKREKFNRPFDEISFCDQGMVVTEDRPMLLQWQEDKLREYAARISANGGNPDDYMDIAYTISEKKYQKLSDEARRSLNAAGKICTGRTVISISPAGERHE